MDVLFVSSARNYTTDDADSYVGKVQQFVETFRNRRPESGIVLVSQNPEFPPSIGHQLHNQRIMALRMLAAEYGYGYRPAAEEFKSVPDGGKSLTQSEGVPTQRFGGSRPEQRLKPVGHGSESVS